MPKKPRRRKGDDNDATVEVDALPDDHTVADSLATSFDGDFEDDASIDDLLSTGSGAGGDNSQAATSRRHAKAVDALADIQDLLSEKRSSKRESGLRRIFRAISQYGDLDTCAPHQSDLVALCMQGLRGGSPAEQYASCRCLEAMAVVLGADNDEYYEGIEKNLRRVVMMTGRAMMVRGAALRCLSLTNFVCSTDDVSTESLLDLAEEVAAKEYRQHQVPATLRATALDCWALLATTIHDFYVSGGDDDNTGRGLVLLPLIQECLDDASSLELRTAAGQCMVLIHESRLTLGEQDGDNTTERKFGTGGWTGSPYEVMFDEMQQRISELSNQSGHSISKKAKKEQRATFREFLGTIMDNEAPDEVIAFRGGTLNLSSWKAIVQLQFVRHCLQGGFQIQLLTNPTLQMIFGADGAVLNSNSSGMSQLEKRLYMSKTSEASKLEQKAMTKKRRTRNNIKNHFLTTDGDDL